MQRDTWQYVLSILHTNLLNRSAIDNFISLVTRSVCYKMLYYKYDMTSAILAVVLFLEAHRHTHTHKMSIYLVNTQTHTQTCSI